MKSATAFIQVTGIVAISFFISLQEHFLNDEMGFFLSLLLRLPLWIVIFSFLDFREWTYVKTKDAKSGEAE